MAQDFEKYDEVWMKMTQAEREQKVPSAEIRNFSAEVTSRIYERRMRHLVFWIGMGVLAATGMAMLWVHFYMVPMMQVPVQAPAAVQAPAPQPSRIVEPLPSQPAGNIQIIQGEKLRDEDLVEEIEIMKELGVWTDDDEEAVGISQDAMIQEVESYMESESNMLTVSVSPAG